MLNPDGVRYGNHRCNIYGKDLNRTWIDPDPFIHTSIFHTKELVKKLSSENKEIILNVDIHGHSKSYDAFIYGYLLK